MTVPNFLCILLSAHVAQSANRINAGSNCQIKSRPFVVHLAKFDNTSNSLTMTLNGTCAGALLTPLWVLTAAVCFDADQIREKQETVIMTIGRNTIYSPLKIESVSDIPGGELVEKGVWAPYGGPQKHLGLLKLARSISVTPVTGAPPVGLAKIPEKLDAHLKCPHNKFQIQGWEDVRNMSKSLVCAEVMLQTNVATCANLRQSGSDSKVTAELTVIYTFDNSFPEPQDVCAGDLGTPLLCNGVVVGVATVAACGGNYKNCSMFTKLEAYTAFLKTEIPDLKIGLPLATPTDYKYRNFGTPEGTTISEKPNSQGCWKSAHYSMVLIMMLITHWLLIQ